MGQRKIKQAKKAVVQAMRDDPSFHVAYRAAVEGVAGRQRVVRRQQHGGPTVVTGTAELRRLRDAVMGAR